MKNIYFTFFIILSFLSGYSQKNLYQHTGESFNLSQPLENFDSYEYTASKFIKMEGEQSKSGFQYSPDPGQHFQAKTDPMMVFPPTEGEFGGPNTGDNGVVGTIPGEFSVSPTGAAIYTVPIDLPPGINGMTPELSLLYNSQLKEEGVLGKGWGIQGWSIISRINETQYYEGYNGSIDFNNDQYMLDGKRLIYVDDYNGEQEYRTEQDEISKIIRHNNPSTKDDITCFFVYTKSGLIKEYGTDQWSRQKYNQENNPSIRYHIKKITDQKGNYIEYHYNEKHINGNIYPLNVLDDGEVYLSSITYSGNENGSLDPYYMVKFYYTNIPEEHCKVSYFNNQEIEYHYMVKKRLDSISVIYIPNSNILKTYKLSYSELGELSKNFLSGIELECGNNKYNPLLFNWYTSEIMEENSEVFCFGNYFEGSSFPPKEMVAGDFTGDGISDILITKTENNNLVGFELRNGPNFYDVLATSTESFTGTKSVYDLNGDGIDELLIYVEGDNNLRVFNFKNIESTIPDPVSKYCNEMPIFGDFDGKGIVDCIFPDVPIIYFGEENLDDLLSNGHSVQDIPQLDIYRTIDSNGDGKAELLNYDLSSITLYSFINNAFHYEFTFNNEVIELDTQNEELWALLVGDFNADGKQDLFYNKATITPAFNSEEYIFYSYGGNFLSPGVETNFGGGSHSYIADINNDGYSDILTYSTTNHRTPENTNPDPEISIHFVKTIKKPGTLDGFESYSWTEEYYDPDIHNYYANESIVSGDFTGNGEPDIIYSIVHHHIDHPSYLNTHERSVYKKVDINNSDDIITSITNGFGSITSINTVNYHCNDDDGTSTEYPILNYKSPLFVVNNTQTDDLPITIYNYKAAKIHITGKGILGFKETEILDLNSRTFNHTVYDYYIADDPSSGFKYYYLPYAKIVEHHSLDENNSPFKLISHTENQFAHKLTCPESNFVFLPFISKSLIYTQDIDLAGTTIKSVKTLQEASDIDIYGNSLESKIFMDPDLITDLSCTNFDYVTTVNNTYNYLNEGNGDVIYWWVDRIAETTIKKESPNSTPDIITTTFEYYGSVENDFPLLKKEIVKPNPTDPEAAEYELTTEYNDYDLYGNLLEKAINDNDAATPERIILYDYDNDGTLGNNHRFLTKISKSIDGYIYDEEFEYDVVSGKLSETTDVTGLNTYFYYDEFGKLKETVYPDGVKNTAVFRWSEGHEDEPNGALFYSWSKQSGNAEDITFYDKHEQKVRTVTKGFNSDEKIYIDYYYYDNGLLSKVSEPYFSTTQPPQEAATFYNYDDINRIWQETAPTGLVTTYSYEGRTTIKSVVIDGANISVSETVNAIGLTESITDPAGTITYMYNSAGNPVEINAMGSITTMTYDPAGNQETLDDPNAGLTKYKYNAFGDLVFQGNIQIQPEPDELYKFETVSILGDFGRLEQQDITNNEDPQNPVTESTYFEYYDEGNGKGKIHRTWIDGGIEYQYIYNEDNRLISLAEIIDGVTYESSYDYNIYGKIKKHTSPSGYTTTNHYNSNGYFGKIRHNGNTLWELTGTNERGQVTDYHLGNGLLTELGFDQYGFPSSIITDAGNVQDLRYVFHPQTGNLMQRNDERGTAGTEDDNIENFTYDNLLKNRLETWQVITGGQGGNGQPLYSISYEDPEGQDIDNNGNIYVKSDVTETGSFFYGENTDGPHAVSRITGTTTQYYEKAQETQTIDYTPFGKIKFIEQEVVDPVTMETNIFRMNFVYGPDQARKKTILTNVTTGETIKTKIYAGNCEYEEDGSGNSKILTYVANVGIYVEESGQGSMYYIHTDYLGNYQAITDENGIRIEEISFDPWGRRRNPVDWSFYNVPEASMFDRGFTGHEHLDLFGLINMNGRMYDPWLGRFLSPDNFVQAPENTQNFNRYAYCLNNPLKYTDPSGEYALVDDIIAAALGGVINLVSNAFQGNIHNLGDGLAAFGAGAVGGIGAIYPEFGGWAWGGAVVGATNSWLGGAQGTDILIGAGVGVVSGVVGGAAGQWAGQNIGGVLINGFNVASPVLKGAITGAVGGAAGGYVGGFAGGLIMTGDVAAANKAGMSGLWSGATVGGVIGAGSGYRYATKNDINPWTGIKNNSVTIGEDMWRVNSATKDLGNSNINKDWPADMDAYYDKPSRMTNPQAMDFNGQWIEIQIDNKVYIYDIGTPNGGPLTSPFYNIEVGRTMVYPNVINVQYIHYQQTIRILIINK